MRKFAYILLLLTIELHASGDYSMVPGVVVAHSAKSTSVYRGTPSIVRLPTGELLATNDVFSDVLSVPNRTDVFISRDNGKHWSLKSTVPGAYWSTIFYHKGAVYLIGLDTSSGSHFGIRKSTDKGTNWTARTIIDSGACHGSSTAVCFANGRIYRAYEHHYADSGNKWMSGNAIFVASIDQNADLMNGDNWTVSNEVQKPQWVDGTGWLEANAVVRPDGKVCCLSRLASDEGIYAGYFEMSDDRTIDKTTLSKRQFWGGASKFTVKYDPVTQRYWSLANYVPDSLQKVHNNRSAGGMRSVLALTSSADLNEWTVNAIVLASEDVENVGFQYVDFIFDNEDILFVSRTAYDDGEGGAYNYHNANFMTFHRIPDYATVTTADSLRYLLPNGAWNGCLKEFDMSGATGDRRENPIVIDHPGQLVRLSEEVYKGKDFKDTYFRLARDLDLNYQNFLPIGWYTTRSANRPFSGHLDGGGHCIRNLKVGRHDDINHTNSGLFGYLCGAEVQNLGIDGNVELLEGGVSGALCSMASSSVISNCFARTKYVGATSQAGALVGYAYSGTTISDCYAAGYLYLGSNTVANKYIGGLVGYLEGTISNSYARCSVNPLFEDADNVGGVVGCLKGSAINCYYCIDSIRREVNGYGMGKTLAEMQSSSFLSDLNVNRVWVADSEQTRNDGLPVLAWETEEHSDALQSNIGNTQINGVYDVWGRLVKSQIVGGDLQTALQDLSPGLYLVVSGKEIKKILK